MVVTELEVAPIYRPWVHGCAEGCGTLPPECTTERDQDRYLGKADFFSGKLLSWEG